MEKKHFSEEQIAFECVVTLGELTREKWDAIATGH